MDHPLAKILATIGALLLVGFLTDVLGKRTPLPRVTLLLLFGFAFGPSGLDWIPDMGLRWFPLVSTFALVMVGFLLGEKISARALRVNGRLVMGISLAAVAVTAAVVFGGLWAIGAPPAIALLLAGIATATDPAATTDVARELRARGLFTSTLLGVVAIDDAWGIIAFSLLFAAAQSLEAGAAAAEALRLGGWELGGALLLGIGLGIPMALLTGRVREGEPTLAEALGFVFLCGGIAIWMEVSYLLAAVAMGATVANLARHHTRPFHAIEGIEWPFLILFFALAGASLQIEALPAIGAVGAGYVVFRIIGRALGGWVGSRCCRSGPHFRRWIGLALLPQAGVAMAMVIAAGQKMPAAGAALFPVVIASTVFFELVGPVLTRMAILRSGEASPGAKEDGNFGAD